MIKNQANIYQFVLRDMIGQGITGLSPTVRIRKDTGSFSAATNAVSEVGDGLYEIVLTATECNCDIMAIKVSLPDGQFPAILTNEYLTTTGGATPQQIWEYTGGRTVTNTIPTAADNATAVWGASSRTLTNLNIQSELTTYGAAKTTDLTGLATATALATVGDNVGAVKAKTDNLPANPAAVTDITNSQAVIIGAMPTTAGLATASDVTTAQAAIIGAMPDVSGLATSANVTTAQNSIIAAMPDISGLSTFDPATDTVTIDATQAAGMATATGFATPTNITDAVTALETYGDGKWLTADVSNLATSTELTTAESNIISAMPDVSGLPTAADVWDYTDRTLTEEISVEISSENIADITESVWNADDRTLTDLTPKPNQKNIVCTPTNVLNSYGLRRMENWTNEQAGTPAFDTIVNNYIALAKEQMAVDLNNHINAAINYVGADMVTELCAWLTGYKLYSDDESRTTDNLPETRYNMYLEQIHRIMENV